jgi:hypothetical protein
MGRATGGSPGPAQGETPSIIDQKPQAENTGYYGYGYQKPDPPFRFPKPLAVSATATKSSEKRVTVSRYPNGVPVPRTGKCYGLMNPRSLFRLNFWLTAANSTLLTPPTVTLSATLPPLTRFHKTGRSGAVTVESYRLTSDWHEDMKCSAISAVIA